MMTKELEMTNIEFLKEHIEQLKEVLFDDNVPKHIIESVEKELEYWESISKELNELKAIKEGKPSEALRMLADISYLVLNEIDDLKNKELWKSYFTKIKQTLLKAQEQEQELAKYKEMMPILIEILKGCKMRYEDTFEPNMRIYMSKDICEKINKFLEMMK